MPLVSAEASRGGEEKIIHGLPTDLFGLPFNSYFVLTHFGLNQTFRKRFNCVESRTWATERKREVS
jgi:hypothetical protein